MKTAYLALAKRAAIGLIVLLGLGIALRQANLLDRQFIFFPDGHLAGTPGDVGLDFEDVFFSAADGAKLHGWFIPAAGDVTFVWFHGNAGNISHRLDNLLLLHQSLGANIFIFDYRGYGRSEGGISENGMYMDAEAALEYLGSRDAVDPSRIVLFGRSLGGAVAVEMATRRQVHGLILESPFNSVRGMAERSYPYLPVGVLIRFIRSQFDSLSKIKDVHSPLLVLHGDRDHMIPIDVGREVFDAANPPKRFYVIEGAGHNDTYQVGGEDYFEALKRFVADPVGSPKQ